jgi:hypothetical protein
MNKPLGYNLLRWDCERAGCFNVFRRPKIEMFAECFPGRINFGDIDGLVEMRGYFCLLEWKTSGEVSTGQKLTYARFTRPHGNVVWIVIGDAKDMTVQRYSVVWRGKSRHWVSSDLDEVKRRIKGWAYWVKHQPERIL